MKVKPKGFTVGYTSDLNNPAEVAIKKFESHPSILTTKESISVDHLFQFEHYQVSEILEQISEIDGSKNGGFKNFEKFLAKWLSVLLRTKWLWVRIQLLSLQILQISRLFRARSSLTFREL